MIHSLFVVDITYTRPLDEIDGHVEGHMAFIREQYAKGIFIVSGPKVPREGGVILAKMESRSELDALLDQDPFKKEGVAKYTVTEFVGKTYAPGFDAFMK